MNGRKFFRAVLVLAGLCVGLWQSARLIEVVENSRARSGSMLVMPHGTAALPGIGQNPADLQRALSQQLQAASLVTSGSPVAPAQSGQIVVFTPNGNQLDPAQREALLREAERSRPTTAPQNQQKSRTQPSKSPE